MPLSYVGVPGSAAVVATFTASDVFDGTVEPIALIAISFPVVSKKIPEPSLKVTAPVSPFKSVTPPPPPPDPGFDDKNDIKFSFV